MKAWNMLMEADCDLERHRAWTVLELRVLAATPRALRGEDLDDEGMEVFFRRDMQGLIGAEVGPPTPEEHRCIQRLDGERESAHKRFPMPKGFVQRILHDENGPDVFASLQFVSAEVSTFPYRRPKFKRTPPEGWFMWSSYPECEGVSPGEDCGGYTIDCPVDAYCDFIAAG